MIVKSTADKNNLFCENASLPVKSQKAENVMKMLLLDTNQTFQQQPLDGAIVLNHKVSADQQNWINQWDLSKWSLTLSFSPLIFFASSGFCSSKTEQAESWDKKQFSETIKQKYD